MNRYFVVFLISLALLASGCADQGDAKDVPVNTTEDSINKESTEDTGNEDASANVSFVSFKIAEDKVAYGEEAELIANFQNTGGARGEYEESVYRAEKRFEYGDWEPTNVFRGNISPGQTKEAVIEKEMGRTQTFMYRMEGDNDTITVQPRNLSLGSSVVNNGGVKMEIQNFEINETYLSDDGKRRSPYPSWRDNFLMMNYSATNTLDKNVTAGHAYDIEVLINGTVYQQTWHEDDIKSYTPYEKTTERFNPLEPGETRTGHLTFTIPKNAQRENVVFRWNGKVFWNR